MKVQLIHNPVAGTRNVTDDLAKAIAFLESQDWQVQVRRTLGSGDATTFAREAVAEHCEMVVAVGGDGTLGEVATGLVGSECVLGVLPVGTGNVWAHMVGLPVWSPMNRGALLDAARILVEGESKLIDLGRAGDRYFVLWSGVGFDAQVAHGVEPHREMRRSLGNITYLVAGLAAGLSMRGVRITVIMDGRAIRQRALLVLVSNAQLYGHSWRLAPQAQLDDGMLDVYIFKGVNVLDLLRHLLRILVGEHMRDTKVEVFRARKVEIRGERSLPLHLDGDPAGYTPVVIRVVPKVLRVVVPSWASGSLFEGGVPGDRADIPLIARIGQRLRYERERLREEGERLRDDWSRRLGFPPSE